jgi:hypothetical protein
MNTKKLAAAFTVALMGAGTALAADSTRAKERGWTDGPSAVTAPEGYTTVTIKDNDSKKNQAKYDGGVYSAVIKASPRLLKDKNDFPADNPSVDGYVVIEVPKSDVESYGSNALFEARIAEFSLDEFWREVAKAADEKDPADKQQEKLKSTLQKQMNKFAEHLEKYTDQSGHIGINVRVAAASFALTQPDPAVVEQARADLEAKKQAEAAAKQAKKEADKADKERRKQEDKEDKGRDKNDRLSPDDPSSGLPDASDPRPPCIGPGCGGFSP